jgi:hypothetical protein
MRLRDMKYISFKHQRKNKQNSDKNIYLHLIQPTSDDRLLVPEGIIPCVVRTKLDIYIFCNDL